MGPYFWELPMCFWMPGMRMDEVFGQKARSTLRTTSLTSSYVIRLCLAFRAQRLGFKGLGFKLSLAQF